MERWLPLCHDLLLFYLSTQCLQWSEPTATVRHHATAVCTTLEGFLFSVDLCKRCNQNQ